MCGRYLRRSDKQRIAEQFRVANDISHLAMPPDDYNIAPSTFQPVIRESRDDGIREMVLMRWGLIPFFTKRLADVKGISTINARAESISTSPAWREPFRKRRCLIPVSGFYEWQKLDAKTKKPYTFSVTDSNLFAFAGLWDAWKDEQGQWLQSFSIVTTEANELMSQIHTRMPVILHTRDYDRWLSREITEQPPTELLRPFESDICR
ncbi:SOS response-associated peptidase [Granulicella arctica]|uniref:SOS response-associated peptidase n=1 Tax=Granulicella arctica TaxID=940613 RepID=UPI0021DFA55D|nr:SOS response-associated peptidase [Granulicella arctica]